MIRLAQDTLDKKDIKELSDWLLQSPTPKLTKGELTCQYEDKYAELNDRKYSVFVNSGSSANLLMIYSLIATKRLKNNKIIVPSLAWITTISPIIQFGLTPVLCDINLENLSVDLKELEKLFIQENPSAFVLVTILGIVPDMDKITSLCKKYDVILLCDNCESEGSKYNGKSIESFGLISSCSKYFGHITSCIEGGNICTDDKELYDMCKMLRSHGWSRDLDEETKEKLKDKYLISEFNSLYTFYETGFNVRSTDLNAFIALRQIEKRNDYTEKRYKNFLLYDELLTSDYFRLYLPENTFVSNLGYPVVHPKRDEIVKELAENDVEVRPLISGSMGTQPFWWERYGKQILPNSSLVDKWGFYVPNHALLKEEDIAFICNIINKYN